MKRLTPDEVLEFWFGELDPDVEEPPQDRLKTWFAKDPEFDAKVSERFGPHIPYAAAGGYDDWLETPTSRMALLILLDQFTRNSFRGSPHSWSSDGKAREVALAGIRLGHDTQLHPVMRLFFYLPLEHAEDLALQDQCVALVTHLAKTRTSDPAKKVYQGFLEYAHKHRDVIRQFGRFPHRNVHLNRESTPEELEYLSKPGAGF